MKGKIWFGDELPVNSGVQVESCNVEDMTDLERLPRQDDDRLEAAHKHCSLHRVELQASSLCGCFYCFAIFVPAEVSEWIDGGQTAECPKCTIDSVIGSASGYPITAEFLNSMHAKWF